MPSGGSRLLGETRPAGAADAGTAPAFGYRPALDGVRAVAVLMVIWFHAGLEDERISFGGGWLGVDIFFVLSGYLITALLIDEHRRHGRVRLREFYMRRVLRLYPLIVAVLVVSVASALVLRPGDPARTQGLGIAAIALYFVNWLEVYRFPAPELGTFTHLWSLAVEEQFYVVWPIVAATALRLRRARALLLSLSAAVIVVESVWRSRMVWAAMRWNAHNPFMLAAVARHRERAWDTWYFGSLLHSDGLLLGCFLAALLGWSTHPPRRATRRVLAVGSLAAIAAAYHVVDFATIHSHDPRVSSWGMPLFTASTAVVVAHLVVSPTSALARVLGLRPLVWVGRRAYGLYVFHPVLFTVAYRLVGNDHGLVLAGSLTATFVLAGLSYRWYERPFLRLKTRFGGSAERT